MPRPKGTIGKQRLIPEFSSSRDSNRPHDNNVAREIRVHRRAPAGAPRPKGPSNVKHTSKIISRTLLPQNREQPLLPVMEQFLLSSGASPGETAADSSEELRSRLIKYVREALLGRLLERAGAIQYTSLTIAL